MKLISIDCGARGCGVALFLDGKLFSAGYVRNPMRHGHGANSALAMAEEVARWSQTFHPDQLAIETMQWYEAEAQKGDQNDLGAVQLVAGTITGKLGITTMSYRPREWKGTVDGDVCTNRILDRLTDQEKYYITHTSAEVDHNTIDGIGIGLKYLGRFEPRRVYARE